MIMMKLCMRLAYRNFPHRGISRVAVVSFSADTHVNPPRPDECISIDPQTQTAQSSALLPHRRSSHRPAKKDRNWPFDYHEVVTCKIDAISGMGLGVARVSIDHKKPMQASSLPVSQKCLASVKANERKDEGTSTDADGDLEAEAALDPDSKEKKWVVLVPRAMPGEVVTARVYRNHKGYSEADLLEVLQPSPDRVEPQCKYFSTCGGCQYQMSPLDLQRKWKRERVQSLLSRIAGLEHVHVDECIGSEHAYGYRTKLTPHYNAPSSPDQLRIGFQQRGTRMIVDVDRCVIATDAINKAYQASRDQIYNEIRLRHSSRQQQLAQKTMPSTSVNTASQPGKDKGATLLFREVEKEAESGEEKKVASTNCSSTGSASVFVETDFRRAVRQTVLGMTFQYTAGEFFQNNAYALPLMVQRVLQLASGDECRTLIDAYCGSGLFSILAHKHFAEVFGVEISELAVKAAVENAKRNGISNVHFSLGSSESIFHHIGRGIGRAHGQAGKARTPVVGAQTGLVDPNSTVVLLDPPRKGCDEVFLKQLISFHPKKIVYVSCDPATQARDAKYILDSSSGYRVTAACPVDLFPQTRHIENIMCFVRD
jgi:23S rRNA (uracil-5-)-methyltransferase RumA